MFCRSVGAGDSLLLLLGDSVESKGMFSILNCFSLQTKVCLLARVDFSPAEQSHDGAVRFGAAVLFFRGAAFYNCINALRNVTKGLQVSVGRH